MDVLLIDEHQLFNAGLASIFEATGLFSVTIQALSLTQAVSIIEKSKTLPSLIILELLLGEKNGLDFLPILEKHCKNKKIPKPPVLVCSAYGDSFKIKTALKLGASGFLSKTDDKAELLKAINTILGGKTYINEELKIKLNKISHIYDRFTRREIDIINLLKSNKTNKQIADSLFISLRTVENYISKIYFKTGFTSREEVFKL